MSVSLTTSIASTMWSLTLVLSAAETVAALFGPRSCPHNWSYCASGGHSSVVQQPNRSVDAVAVAASNSYERLSLVSPLSMMTTVFVNYQTDMHAKSAIDSVSMSQLRLLAVWPSSTQPMASLHPDNHYRCDDKRWPRYWSTVVAAGVGNNYATADDSLDVGVAGAATAAVAAVAAVHSMLPYSDDS